MKYPSTILPLLLAALNLAAGTAHAQQARQDPAAIRDTVEQFLRTQSSGLPGEVEITVGQVDARTNLATCAAPQAFLPGGSRVWGKTTVGVRCTAPAPWTIYVSATVKVIGEYVVTAAPLAQGQTVTLNDLTKAKGDLTALPSGIVTDPAQAAGKTVTASLAAGTPLRNDSLRAQQAVQQGQTVRVVSNGPGFRVSTEAKALNNAADGQVAQARTTSGQVVSGVARSGGVVEVTY
ncbi:flagellar basal body P-ring formation chaperone FlgA [Noviherbaspirillum denitrificans]|uniref:Flagella basal body P-ring formation protein FlgA n=1 Tax=Noviherbaspirillum denitrificans TaxID=1968433 RepID=A0A254THE5_9BURK|nr:flagellar basal body P-ring formation chaperone FlgA [Noviherbaspirillum denitrificans]OWW19983.1 flagellar biosynthesis protein FlgA [Noviherbaspirillum denitrificans]